MTRLALPGLLAGILCGCGGGTPTRPAPPTVDFGQPWMTASPAQVRMDADLLARAAADAERIPRFRSLLVARDGYLVLERYFGGTGPQTLFDARSVTKSVVSTLTGFALAEGRLPGLDATVGQYVGPPYVLDDGDRAVTVRQLLTMTSGYEWNDDRDYDQWIVARDHVQFLLDRPRSGAPGAFTYNSAAVNLLGVVLQGATGTPLATYADERVFRPLGVNAVRWEDLERGMVNGGSGIQLAARDLLRFGQLMLQQGRSGTLQVVPSDWVGSMTTPRFPWRDRYGPQVGVTYGYLWWVADAAPEPAFFGWGYGGQFVYVVPARQLVVVTTTEWRGLSTDASTTPQGLVQAAFGVIVNDVLAAVR